MPPQVGKKPRRRGEEPPQEDVFDPLNLEAKDAGTVALLLASPEEEVRERDRPQRQHL